MLTSTRPRSPPRTTRIPYDQPHNSHSRHSSQSTITGTSFPRPSMPWLSRSSTQSSSPYAPSKPTRISEPKLVRSIELVSQQRSGILGTGATVVRTPDEALRETRVRLAFDAKSRDVDKSPKSLELTSSGSSITSDKRPSLNEYTSSQSPPLPPLPMPEEEELQFLSQELAAELPKAPPRPTRTPPPAPALRSSLKAKSVAPSDDSSHVPPLPANISVSPLPPPFSPVLVSEVPAGTVDPSKIIVTLDTCTTTFRTTLDTLRSRPSHLSKYLSSLFASSERASVSSSSIYSTASDDISTFRRHLTSQGLVSQASLSLHLFLDRPSAPYVHVLNYLRSPVGSPDVPEALPRSAQLHSPSHSRLENLLELRDEAAYLNLDGLFKLCTDEIRLRHRDGSRLHNRGHSGTSTASSIHSLHASVYSLHTLLERVETDIRSSQRDSNSSDWKSIKDGGPNQMVHTRSPPTPQSWNGPTLRGRSGSHHRYSPSRSPPAGWI